MESQEFWIHLAQNVGVSLIFLAVAVTTLPFLWRVIDKITPGNLNDELLGRNESKTPNMALGVVVAAFVLGLCVIVAAAIR